MDPADVISEEEWAEAAQRIACLTIEELVKFELDAARLVQMLNAELQARSEPT